MFVHPHLSTFIKKLIWFHISNPIEYLIFLPTHGHNLTHTTVHVGQVDKWTSEEGFIAQSSQPEDEFSGRVFDGKQEKIEKMFYQQLYC